MSSVNFAILDSCSGGVTGVMRARSLHPLAKTRAFGMTHSKKELTHPRKELSLRHSKGLFPQWRNSAPAIP